MNKLIKWLKLLIVFAIIVAFTWFLVLSPIITFHNNEKKVEDAARRYYEINSEMLPTGERVKTLPLLTLYHKAFLEGDIYSPYSKKVCSGEKSWVKVKKVDGEYKYYVYLDCGLLKSKVDHEGPVIKLNGDSNITVDFGLEYKEPGVSSVVDKMDGKISTDNVKIKGDVDTSKIGTYEVTYTVNDSLTNSTTVTRTVTVVKKFGSTIKQKLKEASNFVGNPDDNYVRLSNILFRIYGLDDKGNVILVTSDDISAISYSKLDKWFDYFESTLNDESKKLLVKSKFCNMTLDDNSLDTTQCSSYTSSRYSYAPSVIEINRSMDVSRNSFIKNTKWNWTANAKDNDNGYVSSYAYDGPYASKTYVADSVTNNYGVRAMLVVKGSALIKGGNGHIDDPYVFGDIKKAVPKDLLNTRYVGEYFVSPSGELWRIVAVDGNNVKAISEFTAMNVDETVTLISEDGTYIYNPDKKDNFAFFFTNLASQYLDTSMLELHEISVPIYKNKIIYGDESNVKKYKVKLAAPDMFEVFSAQCAGCQSYWFINSSKNKSVAAAMLDGGSPVNGDIPEFQDFGVRVVGYVKNKYVISGGNGTISSPYVIK